MSDNQVLPTYEADIVEIAIALHNLELQHKQQRDHLNLNQQNERNSVISTILTRNGTVGSNFELREVKQTTKGSGKKKGHK